MSDCSQFQHNRTNVVAMTTMEKRQQSLTRIAPRPTKFFMWQIQQAVCKVSKLSMNEMVSPRREHRLILPRQVAIILCLLLTTKSTKEIGRKFGGRDHTVILYTRDKMEGLSELLRPILESAPLDYLVRIALAYANEHYPTSPPRTPRRGSGQFSRI